jgi:hypothetical protein
VLLMMVLSAGGLGLLISLSNPSILLIEDDVKIGNKISAAKILVCVICVT